MSTLSVDTIQGKTTANNVQMPSGSIVQVGTQTSVNGLQVYAATTSYTAVGSGLIATITPRFAGNKIRIHLTYQAYASSNYIAISLYRSVAGGSYSAATDAPPSNGGHNWGNGGSFNFIDEPSYTLGQSISYQPYYRGHTADNSVYFGWGSSNASAKCLIYCEEIQS